MPTDYTDITELPGSRVTRLQVERSYSRYKFAAGFCEGRDVLEVACGGGQGLGLLSRKARRVVGGDCEKGNLAYAHRTYKGRSNIKIVELDAHELKFDDDSFDVIILYEAIYYLKSPERFLDECKRVLRSGGVLIICTANKDWPDFNPSPYSYKYYSVPELKQLCRQKGFRTEFFGAFPDHADTFPAKVRSLIKKTVVRLNIMPKTMKGKVLFKRLFYGNMVSLPSEFTDGMAGYVLPKPIPHDRADTVHTALFAVCYTDKNKGASL